MAIEHDALLRILLVERTKVLAFIRSLVRQRELAEDVFQDVCVLALEKRDQIADEQHLTAWLRTAARLRAMNVLRKKQTGQRTLDASVLDLVEPHWRAHDDEPGTALAEALRQCVELLTDKARQLLTARYTDGLDVAELARRHNRPVNSLYVSLSRIHSALADCAFKRVAAGRPRAH